MSVRPVCWPVIVRIVSPCRTTHTYGRALTLTTPCASLVVVEFAILTNEENALGLRNAFGDVALAALLEIIGSNRQRYITAIRFLIDHDARDHDGPVVVRMRVRWAGVAGRH